MRKYISLGVLICVIACQSPQKDPNSQSDTARTQLPDTETTSKLSFGKKTLIGQINNNLKVVFQLQEINGEVSGTYFYEKTGIDIPLEGVWHHNVLVLYELDYNSSRTAKITGTLTQEGFTGTWESLITKKILPVKLTESDKKVSPLPVSLEGIYKNDNPACRLQLAIIRTRGEYLYTLTTSKQELKGKISFYRSLDENINYITLEGIRWAENSGDVTQEDDSEQPSPELPVGIEGVLDESEITIQNTGNAMNSYVKLQGCDDKYIHLQK